MNKSNLHLNFVLFVTTIVIFFSCSKPPLLKNKIISKDDLPTLTVENLVRNVTENGKMRGKIQAPIARKFDGIVEPYWDFPKGISILVFKDGNIETSATADTAIYYESKGTWEASGNVVVSNIKGEVLQTQKLYGKYRENKIYTDRLVKISQADGTFTISKKGFESNSEFTIYQFVDVSGKIAFQDEVTNDTVPPK
jgi:LPS export ABC transporter protein LptC